MTDEAATIYPCLTQCPAPLHPATANVPSSTICQASADTLSASASSYSFSVHKFRLDSGEACDTSLYVNEPATLSTL